MFQDILLSRRRALGELLFVAIAFTASAASPQSALRLEEILWREVHNQDGTVLGSATDVLMQMPSGEIVFILVKPTALYSEAKAVPPGALTLPDDPKAPLVMKITLDEWLNAPHLDWDPRLIVKPTENGAEIYGYYHEEWLLTAPAEPSAGSGAVASRKESARTSEVPRFVSLNNLLLHRVATEAWEQEGFIRGFLLDWPKKRTTHAIVSQAFTVVPAPDEQWFAIPVTMLSPPVEQETIAINANPDALARARPLPQGEDAANRNPSEISLYPAAAVTGVASTPTRPETSEQKNPAAAE